jgi:hypothetical protein
VCLKQVSNPSYCPEKVTAISPDSKDSTHDATIIRIDNGLSIQARPPKSDNGDGVTGHHALEILEVRVIRSQYMRERGKVVLRDPTGPMGNRDLELGCEG